MTRPGNKNESRQRNYLNCIIKAKNMQKSPPVIVNQIWYIACIPKVYPVYTKSIFRVYQIEKALQHVSSISFYLLLPPYISFYLLLPPYISLYLLISSKMMELGALDIYNIRWHFMLVFPVWSMLILCFSSLSIY